MSRGAIGATFPICCAAEYLPPGRTGKVAASLSSSEEPGLASTADRDAFAGEGEDLPEVDRETGEEAVWPGATRGEAAFLVSAAVAGATCSAKGSLTVTEEAVVAGVTSVTAGGGEKIGFSCGIFTRETEFLSVAEAEAGDSLG